MKMGIKTINVAKDFSEFPWARYRSDWEFSGQEFFEDYLDNTEEYEKIIVNLDWTYWYPSSFLSEAFCSYYKKYKQEWRDKLEFHSDEDPSLVDFINHLVMKDEKSKK